jgi:hypothetical protein
MARCSCAGASCSCTMQAGPGLTVLGTGNTADPYVLGLASPFRNVPVVEEGVLNLSDLNRGEGLVHVPLSGSVTGLELPDVPDGGRFDLVIEQVTGGNTITWPASVKWPGGTAPTLSTGVGEMDWLTFRQIGPIWVGTVVAQGIG